jgi:hypothetical protein
MTVIDKILNEWSFRCHDGIVDLNDSKKVRILFEILKEDVDDDILNALVNTDADTKTKVLKYLQKIGKKEDSELKKILTQKNLGALIKTIMYDAQETGQEDDLLDYLKSSDQITLEDLLKGKNLFTLFEQTPLSDDFIQLLIDITGNIGNVAIGRGEIALITLIKNAKKLSGSDVNIDGEKIEIKNRSSKTGGILAPENLKRSSSVVVNSLLIKAVNNLFTNNEVVKTLTDNISKKGARGSWPAKIDLMYKTYLIQKQNNKTQSTFEKELDDVFDKLYGSNFINVKDYLENQDFNINKFKIDLAKKLSQEYFNENKFDYILFIDPNLNYSIYKKDEFINDIGSKIEISGYSDLLPRLGI